MTSINKTAKELFKIAHELDRRGFYDLADRLDGLGAKLALEGAPALAAGLDVGAPLNVPYVEDVMDHARNTLDILTAKGWKPDLNAGEKLKDYAARMVKAGHMSESEAREAYDICKGVEKAVKGGNLQLAKKALNAFKTRLSRLWQMIVDAAKSAGRAVAGAVGRAGKGLKDMGTAAKDAIKGLGQKARQELGKDVVLTTERQLAKGVATDVAGAGARAVGGEAAATLGGVGAAAGTILALAAAFAAGWKLGRMIDEWGLGDLIQRGFDWAASFFGTEGAQNAQFLKQQMSIAVRLINLIDDSSADPNVRARKVLTLEHTIAIILDNPLMKDDPEASAPWKALHDKLVREIARVTQENAPSGGGESSGKKEEESWNFTEEDLKNTPSGSATKKTKRPGGGASLGWVKEMQENLNILRMEAEIYMPSPLDVDGRVGPKTRQGVNSFDPSTQGRVTPAVAKRIADAAKAARERGIKPAGMGAAAPFVPSQAVVSVAPSKGSVEGSPTLGSGPMPGAIPTEGKRPLKPWTPPPRRDY